MKRIFLLLAASSVLLYSCGENKITSNQQDVVATHHDEHSEEIQLNNGKKWKVNEEMVPYVLKGEEVVNHFRMEEDLDFKGLADQLNELNQSLIKSCTMEGPSHDELHKWLHPHLDLVKSLEFATADAMDEGNDIVREIRKSYELYHKYFE